MILMNDPKNVRCVFKRCRTVTMEDSNQKIIFFLELSECLCQLSGRFWVDTVTNFRPINSNQEHFTMLLRLNEF